MGSGGQMKVASMHYLVVLALVVVGVDQVVGTKCKDDSGFQGVEGDCNAFVHCSHGVPHTQHCPVGLVFSTSFLTCVPEYTEYDDCHKIEYLSQEEIVKQCQDEKRVIPHPDCNMFYNCSLNGARIGRFFRPYEDECLYPQLFSIEHEKCMDFSAVECKVRQEKKSGCKLFYVHF
ncbi:hypothetical protein ScPMuIL_009521 [Solemya velum]